jgi:nucleoporin NUP82
MPKVKSYSAAWLSNSNAPGRQLFEPSADTIRSRALSSPSKPKTVLGPRRTIARRGTEVFAAVGKEIRWADLAYLKDGWLTRQPRGRSGSAGVRIKREDSIQSIEDGDLEAAPGLRVCNPSPWLRHAMSNPVSRAMSC